MKLERVIISGGGTGGHIFPALAIADEIKAQNPGVDILFIGAQGKMEMEKVPLAGYKIVGLNIRGFQRKFTLSNLLLPLKLVSSYAKARRIIRRFKPQVVVGVGGYASGPTLLVAQSLRIPTLLQEQNSFPGKTNRILAKKAKVICVAYEGLEDVFPANKIVLTGNPVRQAALPVDRDVERSRKSFGLDPQVPVVLFIGGSLGARSLNEAILAQADLLNHSKVQILWQTGKFYEERIRLALKEKPISTVHPQVFISDMAAAYTAAEVIVSRAGALSISELCLVGKPAILVPSPNVAEDHQTKNAMALLKHDAVVMVRDHEALDQLVPAALSLLNDEEKKKRMSAAIHELAQPNATLLIVAEINKIARG